MANFLAGARFDRMFALCAKHALEPEKAKATGEKQNMADVDILEEPLVLEATKA